MSITSTSSTRQSNATIVAVVSSLTGVVYYHWYMDGAYVGMTTSPSKSFVLLEGDQSRIEVLDTNDADFDPIDNAPDGYPARRTIVFTRSLDANIAKYRVEQKLGVGSWEPIAYIQHDAKRWLYQVLSPRLDDLSQYQWRVVPINKFGDDGTSISIAAEMIVRTPDAPDFTAAFDPDTLEVTLAAA